MTPYELLVRWGPDGSLRGAHVITRDGDTLSPPQAIDPLDPLIREIMSEAEARALTEINAIMATRQEAKVEAARLRHEAQASLHLWIAKEAAARKRISELEAQLAQQ